jgi:hypothetical protein
LIAAPEPPPNDDWLKRLKEKQRPRPNNDAEKAHLPWSTAIATVRGSHFYRLPGESLEAFIDRVRSVVGDTIVSWEDEPLEKTKLNIINDALHRPLKADDDAVGFDQILPEDFQNYRPDHRIVH